MDCDQCFRRRPFALRVVSSLTTLMLVVVVQVVVLSRQQTGESGLDGEAQSVAVGLQHVEANVCSSSVGRSVGRVQQWEAEGEHSVNHTSASS